MDLNEAKSILASEKQYTRAHLQLMHPLTALAALEFCVAEIERLVAQGPRLFDMGTALAADPVMMDRYLSEATASAALAASGDEDGTGSQREIVE